MSLEGLKSAKLIDRQHIPFTSTSAYSLSFGLQCPTGVLLLSGTVLVRVTERETKVCHCHLPELTNIVSGRTRTLGTPFQELLESLLRGLVWPDLVPGETIEKTLSYLPLMSVSERFSSTAPRRVESCIRKPCGYLRITDRESKAPVAQVEGPALSK